MKNINFRNFFRKIHLWTGLLTGLIVFVVCISGCIYTFQKEIKLSVCSYYTVEKNSEKLSLKALLEEYQNQSDNKVYQIYDFTEDFRSTFFKTSKNGVLYYSFINPYTGKLLKEKKQSEDFFKIVLNLHRNLLLEKKLGKKVVGSAVIVFIISLVTGIFLWFPKNVKIFKSKKGLKSRFLIKKTRNIRKRLYDLHNVLGFYSSFILIIIATTGLGYAFSCVDNALYTLVTFEKKEKKKLILVESSPFSYNTLDVIKNKVDYNQYDRHLFRYFLPKKDTSPLKVCAYPNDDCFGSSDCFYANPSTGEILKTELDIDKNRGAKFRSLYYDIHTGSVLSIWGKILVFIAGLIGTSLPVTGFLMWFKKRKKSNYSY